VPEQNVHYDNHAGEYWKGQGPLAIRPFGEALIKTRDLDPVYVAIHGAHLPEAQACRLLMAYWCFYHLGLAAWMSEQEGQAYWVAMEIAARDRSPNPVDGRRWPRSAERRHFRGDKCVDAIKWLARREPESYVRSLCNCDTDQQVMTRVMEWPLFGPWIAFKAADMMERCAAIPIRFDPNIGLLYKEPREGLTLMGGDPRAQYNGLLEHFSRFKAPPMDDRACGPQEVETVLCKWKSHKNGHYHVGKDLSEVAHGLAGWGPTASRMRQVLPHTDLQGGV
jgi:hypothetical protein